MAVIFSKKNQKLILLSQKHLEGGCELCHDTIFSKKKVKKHFLWNFQNFKLSSKNFEAQTYGRHFLKNNQKWILFSHRHLEGGCELCHNKFFSKKKSKNTFYEIFKISNFRQKILRHRHMAVIFSKIIKN